MKLCHKSVALAVVASMLLMLCSCNQSPASAPASGSTAAPESSSSEVSSVEAPKPESVEPVKEAPAPRIISEEVFEQVSPFTNGYAMALNGTNWGYLGLDGTFTPTIPVGEEGIPLRNFAERVTNEDMVKNPLPVSEEGLYPFYENEMWGIKSMKDNSVIIPAELYCPTIFSNGRAVTIRRVSTSASGGTAGGIQASAGGDSYEKVVVDTSGKELFTLKDLSQPHYMNGLLTVELDSTPQDKMDVVDINGKSVMQINRYYVSGLGSMFGEEPIHTENLALAKSNPGQLITYVRRDKDENFIDFAFVDNTGKTIFTAPTSVSTAGNFNHERIYMKSTEAQLYAMFDDTGKQLTEYIYSDYYKSNTPAYTAINYADGKFGMVDHNGNKIDSVEFDDVLTYPQESFCAISNAGKAGAVDGTGKVIVPMEYDDVTSAFNGLYWAKKGEAYTLYSLTGEPCDFQTTADVLPLSDTAFAYAVEGGYKVAVVE